MVDEQNTAAPAEGQPAANAALLEQQRKTLAEHRPVAWERSIEARKGKALTEEHRTNLSTSKRGKTPKGQLLWPIAEDALKGLPSTESAKNVGKLQAHVYRVRLSLGFSKGWPGAFRHGEVLTRLHVQEFCSDTGLNEKRAAELIGFGYLAFCNLIGKIPDRPLSSRHPKDPSSPHVGRLLREKYEYVVSRFCFEKTKRWRKRNFLASELLKLPLQHTALMQALENIRAALDRGEVAASSTNVLEWMCRQARREEAEGGKRVFRLLLFFGLSFRDLLAADPKLIGATGGRVSRVHWPRAMASKILAREYGAAESRIDDVVEGKETTPLDPRLLGELLRSAMAEASAIATPPAITASTKRRKDYKHAKNWQSKSTSFRTVVEAQLPRFESILKHFRQVKQIYAPDDWKKQLTQVRVNRDLISEKEFAAVLESKNARAAAIRWASAQEGITYKTGKNLCSQGKVPKK